MNRDNSNLNTNRPITRSSTAQSTAMGITDENQPSCSDTSESTLNSYTLKSGIEYPYTYLH